MLCKGDYIVVNEKIHTHDQYVPPRHHMEGRCGIVEVEHDEFLSIQFYRDSTKDPPLPEKVPRECLRKITIDEYMVCVLEAMEPQK
jgi:hypothetical protein